MGNLCGKSNIEPVQAPGNVAIQENIEQSTDQTVAQNTDNQNANSVLNQEAPGEDVPITVQNTASVNQTESHLFTTFA